MPITRRLKKYGVLKYRRCCLLVDVSLSWLQHHVRFKMQDRHLQSERIINGLQNEDDFYIGIKNNIRQEFF